MPHFEAGLFFSIFVLMSAAEYIQELLYRYNCVVIPEFGALLTHVKPAFIDSSTNTIYPPSKVLSFNSQLKTNDGLLISYMAEAEKTSYEEVQKKLAVKVEGWKAQLKQGQPLVLENIGSFKPTKEAKLIFQPARNTNYLTSSFGLSSIISKPVLREVLKQEVEELEEKVPFIITREERQKSQFRPLLKYAAIIFIALSAGFSGYLTYDQARFNSALSQQKAQEIISNSIQEATFFDTKPLELPVFRIEVEKNVRKHHHIIAGAFREKDNADRKIRQLRDKGYDAFYVGQNKFGLYQVAFESHDDPREALEALKRIRAAESRDAWLLSVK
ncbi:Sporulation related domain-containing protein [Muriicola jejuensis]|nr:SPOR domain-containing protein [Muriicola jejuensis]SMP05120.1 Sporulation related domain-containing protein [Muriicola jejuensis]